MDELTINRDYKGKKTGIIADALKSGGVLILPASTIYGISCLYDDEKALKRIYSIKKRKSDMPFIILISDISQLDLLAQDISAAGKRLIKKYWEIEEPLPLTLIFKKKAGLPFNITGGEDTVATRMAGLEVIRDIIDISGPIVSTSANISGQKIDPVTIEEIPSEIYEKVDMAVRLVGRLKGTGSTIVDMSGDAPTLIREGTLRFEDILADV
jgi:L-threonylcarbamoyladenylate synthase